MDAVEMKSTFSQGFERSMEEVNKKCMNHFVLFNENPH